MVGKAFSQTFQANPLSDILTIFQEKDSLVVVLHRKKPNLVSLQYFLEYSGNLNKDHLNTQPVIQIVGLSGIQMAFENWTI